MELDMNKSRQANIIVDLDSLYDTRLSTLLKIDLDVAKKVIEDDLYNHRLIDEFNYITRNIFRFFYNLRGIETLKKSLLTNITDLIVSYIEHLRSNLYDIDDEKPILLTINTFPYKLSKKVEDEIKEVISNLLPFSGFNVNVDHVDLLSYTPNELDARYTASIMYDGLNWLYEYIGKYEHLEQTIPKFKLICPALLTKPLIVKKKEEYIKLFELTSESFKMFIDLDFINVDMFNVIEPEIE